MVNKSLLLDFDGVVFKKHRLHDVVGYRCEQFVKKYININHHPTLKEMNKSLYESTGHTLSGMHKLGYDISFEDFNKYVYKDIDYRKELSELHSYHYRDINSMRKLMKNYKDVYDIKIFSNAPDEWCNNISWILFGIMIPTTYNYTGNILKPNSQCYELIEKNINQEEYIFVDDKINNLINTPQNGKWHNIWMNPDTPVMKINSNTTLIRNLEDLLNIIQ